MQIEIEHFTFELMAKRFKHHHPYPPYIPDGATKLIVGTLPPPRFSQGLLKEGDVDFCYGSVDGQLWKILAGVFDIELEVNDIEKAKIQRERLLIQHKIGICDMVEYCYREKIDASDLGIQDPVFRPIISILQEHKSVDTLLFTGGNSKNGPEYFFRKHLKEYPEIALKSIQEQVPRIYEFKLDNRTIRTVSLTAPSGSANRAIGSMQAYKEMKNKNPQFTTIDFRIIQYKPYFL